MYSEHLDPVHSSHSPDNSPTRSSYLTSPNSTHSLIINSLSPVSAADLCTARGTPTGHGQPTSGTLSDQSDSSSSMLSMSSRPVLHTVPALLASVKNCFCVWRWYVCVPTAAVGRPRSRGAGGTDGCEVSQCAQNSMAELGPLEEQECALTAEPSLQTLSFSF